MTKTVVAPELWIAAVAAVPIPTPTSFLSEALAKRFLSLTLHTDSRLELSMVHAIRNTPMPAINVRIATVSFM